jgi:DNA-binding response OmpR family regulator
VILSGDWLNYNRGTYYILHIFCENRRRKFKLNDLLHRVRGERRFVHLRNYDSVVQKSRLVDSRLSSGYSREVF